MKILSFTPTQHFKRAIQPGTKPLTDRAFFFRGEIIYFFGLARAVSPLAFAPAGAIQLKEATIENKGRDILSSKTVVQFFSKGVFNHEKQISDCNDAGGDSGNGVHLAGAGGCSDFRCCFGNCWQPNFN